MVRYRIVVGFDVRPKGIPNYTYRQIFHVFIDNRLALSPQNRKSALVIVETWLA